MTDKIIIAIDTMGGENAPYKNIEGLSFFIKKNMKKMISSLIYLVMRN